MGAHERELTRVGSGSYEDCFRDLFPRVARAAALVARDPALGPDLAQEAFARLYQRWDRIASVEHARNFVFRVAINLARSHLRRRLASPVGLHGPDLMVDDRTDRVDDWMVVARALDHLSTRQRACVVLIDYADLDAATVARVLGMTKGTVRVHVSRARRALRDRLAMEEEDR